MRPTRAFLLIVSALSWIVCAPVEAEQKRPRPSAHGAAAAKPGENKSAQRPLPCPRAQWPDDPVCFGADDREGLPVPDARNGEKGASQDVSIEPKLGVNQLAKQPVYINSPNPNPSGSQFGAGMGLKLPF